MSENDSVIYLRVKGKIKRAVEEMSRQQLRTVSQQVRYLILSNPDFIDFCDFERGKQEGSKL